jgi:hypothetical protein
MTLTLPTKVKVTECASLQNKSKWDELLSLVYDNDGKSSSSSRTTKIKVQDLIETQPSLTLQQQSFVGVTVDVDVDVDVITKKDIIKSKFIGDLKSGKWGLEPFDCKIAKVVLNDKTKRFAMFIKEIDAPESNPTLRVEIVSQLFDVFRSRVIGKESLIRVISYTITNIYDEIESLEFYHDEYGNAIQKARSSKPKRRVIIVDDLKKIEISD